MTRDDAQLVPARARPSVYAPGAPAQQPGPSQGGAAMGRPPSGSKSAVRALTPVAMDAEDVAHALELREHA